LTSTRRIVPGLVLAALLVLGVVAWAPRGGAAAPPAAPPAPLAGGPVVAAETNQLSFSREAGTEFSYGLPIAFNRAGEPARIEAVRLERPTAGLKLVGVLAGGPAREAVATSGDTVFPPRSDGPADLHRAAAFAIPPVESEAGSRGIELVLGLTVPTAGRYEMRGVRVTYTLGGRRYERLLPNTLAVCAVPRGAKTKQECALGPAASGETITDEVTQ
jgi:hypothetical protein